MRNLVTTEYPPISCKALRWFLRGVLVLLVLDRASPNKTFGLARKIGVAVVVWQLELLAHRCAKGLILPAHDIVLVGARSAQVKMQLNQYVDI